MELALALEEKSGDHQSQWDSSSGEYEYLYKISWQLIVVKIFQYGPKWVTDNRQQIKTKLLTQEVPGQCGSCSYEDDNEESQKTLAGPTHTGGGSHILRTRVKKTNFCCCNEPGIIKVSSSNHLKIIKEYHV